MSTYYGEDIVDALRKAKNDILDGSASQRVVSEGLLEFAAMEIERLRSELTEISYDLADALPRD